jgi:hypothetical protein
MTIIEWTSRVVTSEDCCIIMAFIGIASACFLWMFPLIMSVPAVVLFVLIAAYMCDHMSGNYTRRIIRDKLDEMLDKDDAV